MVRISLTNGVSHEDCGSGEGINESKIKAYEKAFKSAVTDSMKRAARHLGERLGNGKFVSLHLSLLIFSSRFSPQLFTCNIYRLILFNTKHIYFFSQ